MNHDGSYKQLFSHPEMVAELLRGYVREPWVDQLDFSTLEKVNGHYVSDDLRQRSDDVVWKIRLGPRWLYLYLLLEFQSEVDPFMAVRILTYIGLFYQDLIKQGLVGKTLPPVLPIVVYNGRDRWSAATELAKLIEPVPDALRGYQANAHYWLLDEGRWPEEDLTADNPVTGLLLLERSRAPGDLLCALNLLLERLNAPEYRLLRRAFAAWMRQVLLPSRFPGQDFPEITELDEVRDMLAERVQEWTEDWKQKGLEEGRKKGREEGRKEGREEGREEGMHLGETRVFLHLLTLKFGQPPDAVCEKIRAADEETLLTWSARVLTAESYDEVFRP